MKYHNYFSLRHIVIIRFTYISPLKNGTAAMLTTVPLVE